MDKERYTDVIIYLFLFFSIYRDNSYISFLTFPCLCVNIEKIALRPQRHGKQPTAIGGECSGGGRGCSGSVRWVPDTATVPPPPSATAAAIADVLELPAPRNRTG